MSKSVFEFRSYKSYLLAIIGKTGTRSGKRSEMAKSVGCNTAYISQVLNGHAHFSLEQAHRVSAFLGHTRDEMNFFLILVQFARAGTEPLKQYFKSQLNELIEQRLNIQRRLDVKQNLTPADQATYYSAWHYAAIHVALSIPELRSPEALASYFDLPLKKVRQVLEFLVSIGLAVTKSGQYLIGPTYIHLGKDSENILRHHTQWRLKAIELLDREKGSDIHYASTVTLSRKDAFKIKDIIVENIKDMNKLISESKEEEVYCFTTDFFKLGKET